MALPGIRSGNKPAPFVKPGITLSTELHGSKKRWVKADPRDVVSGDIIRGEGLVEAREGFTISGPERGPKDARAWIRYTMKNGKKIIRTVEPLELVIAFTEAEGEPVA